MSGEILAAITAATGEVVAGSRAVSGGDVNRAMQVDLADGRRLFVKYRSGAPRAMYRAEADGLDWLAAGGGPRVPQVAAVGEEDPAFLALEWIDRGRPAEDHDERLGRELAALHRSGAPAFGLEGDNFIGPLPQRNDPRPTWPDFYGSRRLAPFARAAADRGLLPPVTMAALERLVERLPDLAGPSEPPARLHGDLWGGNAIVDGSGAPVLVDPAVYGGHREVDLAMMRLFGGFSDRVFAAYGESHPLAAGHEDRIDLYQLYPLLVHVMLFGGHYVASFRRTLGRYVDGS